MTGWFEVWRNGEATSCIFLSEANAEAWIASHGIEGAVYEIKPFSSW